MLGLQVQDMHFVMGWRMSAGTHLELGNFDLELFVLLDQFGLRKEQHSERQDLRTSALE